MDHLEQKSSVVSETENAIKIAVIQEQVFGMRQQQKANNDITQNRFNGIEDKLDELTAVLNRGRGAYAASMALAAAIGGVMIEIINFVTSYTHR